MIFSVVYIKVLAWSSKVRASWMLKLSVFTSLHAPVAQTWSVPLTAALTRQQSSSGCLQAVVFLCFCVCVCVCVCVVCVV